MRENLAGAEHPGARRDPGAARRRRAHAQLRRARPARGLRRSPLLRQGRVRGSPHDGPAHGGQEDGRARPRLRARARGARAAAPPVARWRPSGRSRRQRCGPTSPPTSRSSRRRSSARASPRASRSTTSPAYINETALFRNQWQFRPDKSLGENDAEFKERIRPTLRGAARRGQGRGWLVPAVVWGYFPVNADGNDLIVWTDDDRRNERLRFAFPRQRSDRHLCITDFFRAVESGDARLRRVPRGDRRRARLASASGSCSPPTGTRSTCSPTGCRSR